MIVRAERGISKFSVWHVACDEILSPLKIALSKIYCKIHQL
ncbi:hypothetical protein MFFC18_33810 [Mariniblastus fucicola]|uniref:Uncharacterized protein n=1 Tax=Mariniblastus fucicola TaxID=980251 RepID=A0A5B9PF24_9BACT|nr:hypothetical protein MFFC18_33810 [Mariniblastus fucicola]